MTLPPPGSYPDRSQKRRCIERKDPCNSATLQLLTLWTSCSQTKVPKYYHHPPGIFIIHHSFPPPAPLAPHYFICLRYGTLSYMTLGTYYSLHHKNHHHHHNNSNNINDDNNNNTSTPATKRPHYHTHTQYPYPYPSPVNGIQPCAYIFLLHTLYVLKPQSLCIKVTKLYTFI